MWTALTSSSLLASVNWWCQERLSAVQLIRHPQTTFPALTSTDKQPTETTARTADKACCWLHQGQARPGLHRSRPPSTPLHRLHSCGPAVQTHTSTPTAEVQEHIKGLLAQNVIVESHSPYAAPVVIVRKKDGGIRLCVDYRRLSAKTVGDAYPLPRIQESFDALVGAQFFSTLDLASGYHQIAMHPDDQHKTAFVTPMGLFEYTRMPMGLSSAPATFQRLMQSTMSDFIFQSCSCTWTICWCTPRRFDEHLAHLDRLLQRIIDAGLKLKMDKCQFLRRQVHYLGHTVSAEDVSCEAGKVEAVKNWPVPATTTALRSFWASPATTDASSRASRRLLVPSMT